MAVNNLLVVRCGEVPVPTALRTDRSLVEATVTLAHSADRRTVDDALAPILRSQTSGRCIVVGHDADVATILTRLMRKERLDIEVAVVAPESSPLTKAMNLPIGASAADLALSGETVEVALNRDDSGWALVGRATITAPEGPLLGETYCDETVVFSGSAPGVEIRTTPSGLSVATLPRARSWRPWRTPRRRWESGRAVQTGMVSGILTRDDVEHPRPLERCTFYRHTDPYLLVRPVALSES